MIKNILTTGRIPYNYTVGSPSGRPLPVDVRLSVDPDFKRTIIKTATIVSAGIALGILAGFAIKKGRK